MKCSKGSFAVAALALLLVSFKFTTLNAREDEAVSRSFAATHTAKQQCINACRARYRDCRHQNQIPSFECRDVYQDCTRYSCTGRGPG